MLKTIIGELLAAGYDSEGIIETNIAIEIVKKHLDPVNLTEEIGYDCTKYPLHAAIEKVGIYPHAMDYGDNPYTVRTDYMNGWNAAVMAITINIDAINKIIVDTK